MKYIKAALLLFSVAMLNACGGGSSGGESSQPTTLTGVFIDSAVEGLHYETPTHSGITNVNGEFEYFSGEFVTFSIGGIVLGSATGATQITPFDLFGLTAPSTELALRLELNNNNVTDFDRVTNIALLLLALDNDSNPDNGIDLTGWDATLSNANLSFDTTRSDFFNNAFQSFAKDNAIVHSVSINQTLLHLYASLGIIIPVNALSLTSLDYGNDGSVNKISEITYTPEGLFESVKNDDDNDSFYNFIRTLSHDSTGRLILRTDEFDTNDDGVIDRTVKISSTFDANDNLLTLVEEIDSNGDGTINSRTSSTNTYDERDNFLTQVKEFDSNADSNIESRFFRINTYSANNKKLTAITATDSNNDSVIDFAVSTTFTYDVDDNLLTIVRENDDNADGTANSTFSTTYTYDSNGNQLTELVENDINGDGTLNKIVNETRTFNANGQQLSSIRETDSNADG
ncbi:MAG: hypothetical protein KAU21_04935, partial [Gammaproteobacteria bacterium]|nr:hypothetical protein [Gammaproteobacteria bacterium]